MKIDEKPKIPLSLSASSFQEIVIEKEVFAIKIEGEQEVNFQADHISLQQSRIIQSSILDSEFNRSELTDIIFENNDFSNCEWLNSSFYRVYFINCKFIGNNFAEGYFINCCFEHCVLDFSSFNYTTMKNVTFIQCRLTNSEFSSVKWKALTFSKCELTATSWFHTSMKKINLSDNYFERLLLSVDQIPGLIVNQEQAILIAQTLGLVIQG